MENLANTFTSPTVRLVTAAILSLIGFVVIWFGYFLIKEIKAKPNWLERKKHVRQSKKLIIILALIVLSFFALMTLNSEKTSIVTGKQFSSIQKDKLEILEDKGYYYWYEAKLFMVDVRPKEDFDKEHIKGSNNLEPKELSELKVASEVDFVVIGNSKDIEGNRKIYEQIYKNSTGQGVERKAKMYILTDGYEGLKKAGLKIEPEKSK